jgi:hypothetical protein
VTKTSKNHNIILTGKNRELLIRFLKNLLDRKFTDAERVLESFKDRDFSNIEFKKGYINALEGMILSSRSGDERDFFNKANFNDKDLKDYQKEFSLIKEKVSTSNFDRGYFSAWSDVTQYKLNNEE